jgi:hypothetical protein
MRSFQGNLAVRSQWPADCKAFRYKHLRPDFFRPLRLGTAAAIVLLHHTTFTEGTGSMASADLKHSYFSTVEQQRLDASDTEAFSAVTTILLCIVSAGLLLGVVSVLAIMAMS